MADPKAKLQALSDEFTKLQTGKQKLREERTRLKPARSANTNILTTNTIESRARELVRLTRACKPQDA
jgi:hypothetical protein